MDVAVILGFAVMFIMKIVDNMLGTSKTILIQKGRGLLAALTGFISQIIFYKLIDAVNSDGDIAVYVISVGSAVGTYLAIKINDKISKVKTYVNIILSDDKEAMMAFRDYLKEHKITNVATDAYTKEWDKTIAITAYAETKAESRLIDSYISNSETKFKRKITKE